MAGRIEATPDDGIGYRDDMAVILYIAGGRLELADQEYSDDVVDRMNAGGSQAFYLANGGNVRVNVPVGATWAVEETPPTLPAPPVQLYRFSRLAPEGTRTDDPRPYIRREYDGLVGIPEWGIEGSSTMPGTWVVYRTQDAPFEMPARGQAPEIDRDFTPIP